MKNHIIISLLFLSVVLSQQLIPQITETYENGNIKSITYHKKTRNGIGLVKSEGYYESGQKKEEVKFKGGKRDGLSTRWYENGQKKEEVKFKGGKRDGLSTRWYENGQKKSNEQNSIIGLWENHIEDYGTQILIINPDSTISNTSSRFEGFKIQYNNKKLTFIRPVNSAETRGSRFGYKFTGKYSFNTPDSLIWKQDSIYIASVQENDEIVIVDDTLVTDTLTLIRQHNSNLSFKDAIIGEWHDIDRYMGKIEIKRDGTFHAERFKPSGYGNYESRRIEYSSDATYFINTDSSLTITFPGIQTNYRRESRITGTGFSGELEYEYNYYEGSKVPAPSKSISIRISSLLYDNYLIFDEMDDYNGTKHYIFRRTQQKNTPESVMMTIFSAARTGKVEVLKSLLSPGATSSVKALCNPGNESMRNELGHNYATLEEFKNYFSKAKIVGKAIINGDQAEVNFVFVRPNGERDVTMHLQRIKGKWYLASLK